MNAYTANVDSRPTPIDSVSPRLRLLLCAVIGLVCLIAVLRASVCWSNDRYMDHTAGAWTALAADLKDGVFYRPLLGPDGYGGTRYFPLYFVLHAMLLKLGLPVLASGYLLSALGFLALLAGTFYLLRKLDIEPWLAACSAGAVLASYSAQLSLLSTRADGLASALNVWGMALSVHPKLNHWKILLASFFFTLAWSAKLTTVFGFAAAFIWLLFAGQSAMAWILAAETAAGCLAVAGAMVLGSQGRIWGILRACAAGGASPMAIASGPWHMLNVVFREDPGLLLFFFLALLALSGKTLRSAPALFFIATIVVTAMIFGSPGANFNHLLDVQVAAVILIAAWLGGSNTALLRRLGVYAFALAALFAAIFVAHKFRVEDRLLPANRFERAITLIGDTRKPILAENPLLPVLAGQRPYVLDPFMLRLLQERQPDLDQPLLDGLHLHNFSAVVLFMRDPRTDEGKNWYEHEHFGPGFLRALNTNYRLAFVVNGQFIYLPERTAP